MQKIKIVLIFLTLTLVGACSKTINCCPIVAGSVIENPRTVGDYVVNATVYRDAYQMCLCK